MTCPQLFNSSFASKIKLKDIWSIAKPTETQLEKLALHLKESKNNSARLWEFLNNDDVTKSLVPKLELLIQLNNLTLGNLPLIEKISKDNSVDSLEDLAGRTLGEWQELIGGQAIPEEIKGEPEERIKSYVVGMKRMVDYLSCRNVTLTYAKEDIEIAAYYNWRHRGCPIGDELTDWLKAESFLRNR